jgi:hypothetical protein
MNSITKASLNWLTDESSDEALDLQPHYQKQSNESKLKNAQRIIKEANKKTSEDDRNKSKKLQRILQDHEDIIDVIRTEMTRVGFDSEQQDFYACACDIKFDVLESEELRFWAELQSILNEHTGR